MKYKLLTLLALLSIAGCSDLVQTEKQLTDSRNINQFLFTQDYGFCNDTICIGESVILKDFSCDNSKKCYAFTITTGDTLYNGLYLDKFILGYNTSHLFSVNYGNGLSDLVNGAGSIEIKYFCNQNYEVIICYE